MATIVEQMAEDVWKSTEIPSPYIKDVFIQGFKEGFDAGAKFGHDAVTSKVKELEYKVRVMWDLLNSNRIEVPFKPEED